MSPSRKIMLMIALAAPLSSGCVPGSTPSNPDANGNENETPMMNDNGSDGMTAELLVVENAGVGAAPTSRVRCSYPYIVFQGPEDDRFRTHLLDVEKNQSFEISGDSMGIADDFAISGSTVLLQGENRLVYRFNAAEPEVRAARVSAGVRLHPNSAMQTDGGDIIAFITEEAFGTAVCWVNLQDSPNLRIYTFGEPADDSYTQVSVDGTRIAFVDGDRISIKDTLRQQADVEIPVAVDAAAGIDFKDAIVVYVDAETREVSFLDVDGNGVSMSTGIEYAGGNLATRGGVICGFGGEGSGPYPAVVGSAGSGVFDSAPQHMVAGRSSAGWGQTCAVTGSSSVFVAGVDEPTDAESDLLSVFMGEQWQVAFDGQSLEPVLDTDPSIVAASNVFAGTGMVAFLLHNGQSQQAHIGYVIPNH